MNKYHGYLIDLDGTMYRGKEKIRAAVGFVQRLRDNAIPYVFVTNNSSKPPGQVAEKLRSFHIPASQDHVITASMATANVIAEEMPGASVYVIGEKGLYNAIKNKGFQIVQRNAEAVAIGIDRSITYAKLAEACVAIQNGARFFSTNPDAAIPTEHGLLPGNGALTAVLTTATGKKPRFIGKPEPAIMEQALEKLGTERERTLMVGDNYDTDISAGIRAGMDTLLVHTGVTTKEGLREYETQPTYTVESLDEWTV